MDEQTVEIRVWVDGKARRWERHVVTIRGRSGVRHERFEDPRKAAAFAERARAELAAASPPPG